MVDHCNDSLILLKRMKATWPASHCPLSRSLGRSTFQRAPPSLSTLQLGDVISLLAIREARKPPSPCHPFGHGKYESIGAFGIAGLLMLTAWETAKSSVVALMAVCAAVCERLVVCCEGSPIVAQSRVNAGDGVIEGS